MAVGSAQNKENRSISNPVHFALCAIRGVVPVSFFSKSKLSGVPTAGRQGVTRKISRSVIDINGNRIPALQLDGILFHGDSRRFFEQVHQWGMVSFFRWDESVWAWADAQASDSQAAKIAVNFMIDPIDLVR
jgi:hypothetical protein